MDRNYMSGTPDHFAAVSTGFHGELEANNGDFPDIGVTSTEMINSTNMASTDIPQKKTSTAILAGLQYKVDDNPPWPTTVLLGFQHYLLLLSSNLATPGIVATIMCAKGDTEVAATMLGSMLFACGICTLLQTWLGARLPIVQCPAFAYIVPMLTLVDVDKSICLQNNSSANANTTSNSNEDTPFWQVRLNLMTGSLMVAAVFEILLGASGILTILLRFIGPLTVAPTIMLMGLGVAKTGFDLSGKQWGISIGTMCLIIVLSECIPVFKVSNPYTKCCNKDENQKTDIVFHKMFSVTISVLIMWCLCYILTISGAFPESPEQYGYYARTDVRTKVLETSPWVTIYYPGKFGAPSFDHALLAALLAGVITSVIESIGDYYTCARIAGALPPPPSAINRGILLEGLDCIFSAAVGSGFGVTSCSQNIGVISLTKVGSRRVVLMAGLIMMLMACFSKFSAFIVTIPDPIIGAAFIVLFGLLAAVGASNLQYVDLNSSRNMVVFGMALFIGLSSPGWTESNNTLFQGGSRGVNQVIVALLSNSMFMACFTALILDNIMPGTDDERGILSWRQIEESHDEGALTLKTYDLPFGMSYIRKWQWTTYIPFSPSFNGLGQCCKFHRRSHDVTGDNVIGKEEMSL